MSVDENHSTTQKVDDKIVQPIVQYLLVRTDLKWGTGAVIAQACHASTAAIYKTITSSSTKNYLTDLENMHKVVLKADKLDDLLEVEGKLKQADIPYHLWIEKPENIATSLAVSPQPKALVHPFLKHLKLLR